MKTRRKPGFSGPELANGNQNGCRCVRSIKVEMHFYQSYPFSTLSAACLKREFEASCTGAEWAMNLKIAIILKANLGLKP